MTRTTAYILGGIGLSGLIIFFSILMIKRRRDTEAIDFFDKVEKSLDPVQNSKTNPAFDANYYKKGGSSAKLLSTTQAKEYAQTIADAWGMFNDDEESINSVYRVCANKAQMSQIADEYYKLTKVSIDLDFGSRLSPDEFQTVMGIISGKPDK